ncbi:MAG: DUF378 domain-containing protein [Alphaproteobacteria bacterium]|nr:DUF378 domain-containing protein [Alphaproteobacteria bacterium]
MKALNIIAQIILIVGGVNWGLVGLFQFDLVAGIFGGPDSVGARIVYIIVGLAAIYGLYLLKPVSQGTGERTESIHAGPRPR